MRVLISGATGLIGTELTKQLRAQGHDVFRLTRVDNKKADEVFWNPSRLFIEPGVVETMDAVINLAGATTGKLPWTKSYKRELIDSRINSTRTLVNAINGSRTKPKVLVSGSASGFYGDRGAEVLTENSGRGTGFLADLADAWETEAQLAQTRVVLARTTMVMSRQLGALGRLLPLIRAGVGGPLGSGKQFWAWISVEDEAAAIIHLINKADASGPYNLTAPEPATCAQIVRGLGKALGRPTLIPVPSFALKLAFGMGAQELLLCSQNMSASRLQASGFVFKHPTLREACEWVVATD